LTGVGFRFEKLDYGGDGFVYIDWSGTHGFITRVVEESIQDIFEPYFTTKDTGTGLGLSITSKIINAHGGDISVKPSERGATFTIRLPLTLPPKKDASVDKKPDVT